MHTFSYIIFIFGGLGRFIIRPFKFWKREKSLERLVNDFESRRDNRGIMIRKELEERYQCMQNAKEEVQKYYELRKLRMYGTKENLD